jgi:hypothetical protein
VASPLPKPIVYPPDGGEILTGSFISEWPDPLVSCPDYAAPAGYAITLQFGTPLTPSVTDDSLRSGGTNHRKLEVCAITAATYVNPDPTAQEVARGGLHAYGAIVLVPRKPLVPGDYAVAITTDGRAYAWSFSVRP